MFRFILILRRLARFALSLKTQRGTPASHSADAPRDDSEFAVDDEFAIEEPFPGVIELEIRDHIDLHTIAPRDIPAVVTEYLREARARGYSTVRIIHGKGTGTQRAVVRRILAATDFVSDFTDAPPYSGGWGATVARLQIAPKVESGSPERESE
jgi:hypothetical protein